MTIYSKGFDAISTNAGATIVSLSATPEETKKVIAVCIMEAADNAIKINIMLERDTIAEDIPLETFADLAPPMHILLDCDVPVGQVLSVIITPQIAGSQGTVTGWIEYEIAA